MIYKFCPVCGGALKNREIPEEDRARLICEDCGFIFYINPTPAVAVILFNEKDEILLVKRKYDPRKGEWSLPAGFLEYDESVRRTAVREAKEETNLDIRLTGLHSVHSAHDDPEKHVLLVIYHGEILGGELRAGDDAKEAKFYALDSLPDRIAFSCHRRVLQHLREERIKNRD